jgi:hypothetical protein
MARRGDVIVAVRKLGFASAGRREHFVVLQSDLLAGIDTLIVAPLDEDAPMYRTDPLVVRVSAAEVGAARAHAVLVHLQGAVRLDRFEAATVGRLSPKSMGSVDRLLRTVLSL